MRYELFLALRYLMGLRRSQPVVSVVAFISVLGIALGVAALIIVLGVMSGFDADLEEKIIGANPHLLIQADGGLPNAEGLIREILETPHVEAASPVVQTQVLLRHRDDAIGVLLRGVDPIREGKVTRLPNLLTSGDWPPEAGEVIVGTELARRWGLRPGDSIEVLGGEKGKPSPLRFSGEFTTGMYEYDLHIALATLETVQAFLGQPGFVSGVGVRLEGAIRAPEVQRILQSRLGYPTWVVSWMDMNRNLFAALKLEKLTMFVILTLIVLVACFNIVATLLMMVVGKTKEVGILKAVGSTQTGTRRIFILAGLIIGLAGTALGAAGGLGLSLALAKYQFIRLPADIYYIDHLPVKLEWNDVGLVVAAALAISWAACLYPAWVAARLEPAKALRYE